MKVNVDIVVGAGYGDEGKGRVTSLIANEHSVDDTIVVLNTGSAQRGHTAWNKERTIRHVFHNFGSATLDGYATYIDRMYIVNPISFRKEWEELEQLGFTPKVYISIGSRVVLPVCMLINQCVDDIKKVLGMPTNSCGMGVYEAAHMSDEEYMCHVVYSVNNHEVTLHYIIQHSDYPEYLREHYNCVNYFNRQLDNYDYIYSKYIECDDELDIEPEKLEKIRNIYNRYIELVKDDNVWNNFLEDVKFMSEHCEFVDAVTDVINIGYKNFVYENSQGLLLDSNVANIPLSISGFIGTSCDVGSYANLHSVNNICDAYGKENVYININYVSRCYATKHGGNKCMHSANENYNNSHWFNDEFRDEINFVDDTNVYNHWQGNIEYTCLDLDLLLNAVKRDLSFFRNYDILEENISKSLYFTCIDQVKNLRTLSYIGSHTVNKDFSSMVNHIISKGVFNNVYGFLNEDNDSIFELLKPEEDKELEEMLHNNKDSIIKHKTKTIYLPSNSFVEFNQIQFGDVCSYTMRYPLQFGDVCSYTMRYPSTGTYVYYSTDSSTSIF